MKCSYVYQDTYIGQLQFFIYVRNEYIWLLIMVGYSVSEGGATSLVQCRLREKIIPNWAHQTTGLDLASETMCILTIHNMIVNIPHSIYILHYGEQGVFRLNKYFYLSSVMHGAIVHITSACSNKWQKHWDNLFYHMEGIFALWSQNLLFVLFLGLLFCLA
jgi:hypothetical protein